MSRGGIRGAARAPVACAAAALLLACGDGRIPLTLYSPHGRDHLTLLEHEFERLHPEVDVRWLDLGSQEVLDRLRLSPRAS